MTISHRVQGAGPAVVLLHAGVADMRMWDAQADALAEDHRVVRCDLRGYGTTPLEPDAEYSDAQDVLDLLDHLEVTTCALVGASYGGYVAQQVATAAPDRVEHLVLLAAPADLVDPDEQLRAVWREESTLVDAGEFDAATELNVETFLGPEASDEARDLVRRMQRAVFAHQYVAGDVEGSELPIDLERMRMPTTVIVGLHDLAFFVDNARRLAAALPDAELIELDWAGHLPSLERPAETAQLVRATLL